MKNKIIEFAHSLGIEKCGVAHYNGKSAFVCLFPYFCGYNDGNISIYAQGKDYHKVTKEKLSAIADFIKELSPQCSAESFADIGPEIDRLLAVRAGLGFLGKNGLVINKDFGSYFFIGYVLCDIYLEPDSPLSQTCLLCNRCISFCPGNAISDSGIDISHCASHISQKKGNLTNEEALILKKSSLIFGCDICQKVCPHNNIKPNAMPEFSENIIKSLSKEDIEGLSNREFSEKYSDCAFSWRGKGVLLRNMDIQNCSQ